jgi:putative transposase
VSHIHRLRVTDRIFFVAVNLGRRVEPFGATEFPLLLEALEASRQRLGFLLCGYVLMPEHWHALIWTHHPLTISPVIHDVKIESAQRLHARRGTEGAQRQHQFGDRFVRHAKEFNERLTSMHLNPARKGLVKRPEDGRWSSCNNFALDRGTVGECPMQD